MSDVIDDATAPGATPDHAPDHATDLAAVDALKVHRIEPEKPRKHLHVVGSVAGQPAADETPPSELAGVHADDASGAALDHDTIHASLVAAMKTVYDPEIPVDIYQLGLIYDIAIDDERQVVIQMTLTAPGCPVAGSLVGEVARKAAEVPGVVHAKVDLVFDPPWTMDKMSDEAKLELGLL